jgi:hypothetical protein
MKFATLIFFALWTEPHKINYYPVTLHHTRQIPTLQGPSKVIPMFLVSAGILADQDFVCRGIKKYAQDDSMGAIL